MTFNRIEFEKETKMKIRDAKANLELQEKIAEFVIESDKNDYGYFWTFAGLPIIQMPEDIVTLQEILWKEKPDLIIETGIAWGGGIALYSCFQELNKKGITIGIDVKIPLQNREAISLTPASNRIKLYEGSSTDPQIFSEVSKLKKTDDKTLIILDSNHTEDHVLRELEIWSKLLSKGDLIYVSDTFLESIPQQNHRIRNWGPGNNPKTALNKFLEKNPSFESHLEYNSKIFASFSPNCIIQKIK